MSSADSARGAQERRTPPPPYDQVVSAGSRRCVINTPGNVTPHHSRTLRRQTGRAQVSVCHIWISTDASRKVWQPRVADGWAWEISAVRPFQNRVLCWSIARIERQVPRLDGTGKGPCRSYRQASPGGVQGMVHCDSSPIRCSNSTLGFVVDLSPRSNDQYARAIIVRPTRTAIPGFRDERLVIE